MRISSIIKSNIVELFLLTIFTFDFLTKILTTYTIGYFSRFGGISKLIFLLFMICYLVKNRISERLIIKFLALLITAFCFGNIEKIIAFNVKQLYSSFYYLTEYLYLFIVVCFFNTFSKEKVNNIFNLFLIVGGINAMFMLVGMVSDIELFRSYPFSERFGFNGIMAQTSEVSYYYIILISVLYYKFCLNRRKYQLLLFFIIISLFIGTKVVWFYMIILTVVHLFRVVKKKQVLSIVLLIPILLLLIYNNKVIYFLKQNLYHGTEIYNDCGIFCLLTSYRTSLLVNFVNYISANWSFYNYIFGGIDFNEYRVEFGLIDLYMFFGIIGLIVYGILIRKYFIGNNIAQTIFVLIILLLSFLAGNFLTSIIVSILFYTSILKFNHIREDYINETNHTRS